VLRDGPQPGSLELWLGGCQARSIVVRVSVHQA